MTSDSTSAMDQHFKYQLKIEFYYRNRDRDPLALSSAIEACKQQINISEKAKKAFSKEFPGPLPWHIGYRQLCIIMEKQKNFDEVIRLANIAKGQGWNGDWDKRIERCKKKIKN